MRYAGNLSVLVTVLVSLSVFYLLQRNLFLGVSNEYFLRIHDYIKEERQLDKTPPQKPHIYSNDSSSKLNDALINRTANMDSKAPVPSYVPLRKLETTHVDCGRILRGDENYTAFIAKKRPLLVQRNKSEDCDAVRKRVLPPMPLKEIPFGIAYARIVYRDYDFIEDELRSTYHPQNYFCYSIDQKSDELFKHSVENLAKCFSNVIVTEEHPENCRHFSSFQRAVHASLMPPVQLRLTTHQYINLICMRLFKSVIGLDSFVIGRNEILPLINHISSRFEETPSEAYPPPPTEYREVLNEQTGAIESASIIQPCSSREQDDTDIEEEIVNSFNKKSFIVPSKSQVLFYLSTSRHLRIHHTGCELQVTDSADFPLFDIWAESACCGKPVWVIESYGRRVLVLSEMQSRGLSSLFPRFLLFRRSTSINTQSVVDWNGDVIGYFLPGDPFLIQDSNRGILGRCVRMEGENGPCWQCFLEGVDREVARLERGHLRFAADVSFQLKLLVLAAMTRVVGQPRVQANCFPFLRY